MTRATRSLVLIDRKRMFRRYCVEPWRLVGPAMADLAATARRKLSGADRAERLRMAQVVRLYDGPPMRVNGRGAAPPGSLSTNA